MKYRQLTKEQFESLHEEFAQFLATQSAKINQSITINASQWSSKKGLKKVLSHFYNQFFLSSNK